MHANHFAPAARPVRLALLAITLTISTAQVARSQSQPSGADKAIAFLKVACVTTGSSLDVKVSADGGLVLRNIVASGVKGSISLSKKELEGFADAASQANAQQATEMRNCMKPHIDKVLTAILATPSKP